MDSSQWTNINSTVQIIPTTRQFYGQFYYKLVYNLVGAALLRSVSSLDQLTRRAFSSRQIQNDQMLFDKLVTFFNAVNQSQGLRWRCEGNSLSVFAETEQALMDLATTTLKDYGSSLVSVTRIANQQDRETLESGNIIMRKPTDYRYKVSIRDGYRNTRDRKLLANYLTTIRSEIRISDHLLAGMTLGNKYLHSCYFYVNDPRIVDMIALVAPTIIKKVQEVVIR